VLLQAAHARHKNEESLRRLASDVLKHVTFFFFKHLRLWCFNNDDDDFTRNLLKVNLESLFPVPVSLIESSVRYSKMNR
jgi:hypothetical protein